MYYYWVTIKRYKYICQCTKYGYWTDFALLERCCGKKLGGLPCDDKCMRDSSTGSGRIFIAGAGAGAGPGPGPGPGGGTKHELPSPPSVTIVGHRGIARVGAALIATAVATSSVGATLGASVCALVRTCPLVSRRAAERRLAPFAPLALVFLSCAPSASADTICNNDCPNGGGIGNMCQDGGPGSEFSACA
jgi:hypothetical protein